MTLVCSVKTDSSTTLTWRKDDTTDIPGVSSFSKDTSILSSWFYVLLKIHVRVQISIKSLVHFLSEFPSSDSLEIAEGKESDVGSYKCQIPGVTQSADSVNVYFTKELVFSPSTSPIYHHNTAAEISFTCSYTKTGLREQHFPPILLINKTFKT